MGLLSSAISSVKSAVSSASKTVIGTAYGANPGGLANLAATAQVIGSNIVSGKWLTPIPVTPKYEGTPLATVAKYTTSPTSLAVAAVAPAAATPAGVAFISSAAKSAGTYAVKSLTSGSPIQVVGKSAVGLVGAGVVLNSPKTVEAAIKAPGALFNFGGNVGAFVENPSIETGKAIIKENPLISASVAVIAAYALQKAYNTAATIANTDQLKKGNELLERIGPTVANAPPPTPEKNPEPKKDTPTGELPKDKTTTKEEKEEEKAFVPVSEPVVIPPPKKKTATKKKKKKVKASRKKAKPKKKKAKPKKKKAKPKKKSKKLKKKRRYKRR